MHQWMDAVWMSVSWPMGNNFVVTSAATTASRLKSNRTAHSHDMTCDIAGLNVPETGDISPNFSRARGGQEGTRSSLVYSPLHTVVFIKSQEDRWRFQSEKNQCLCRQTARTSQRSGTVCGESAAEPSEDCFHFAGFLLLPFSRARCHIARFNASV